jgi:hypothetical protein
MTPSSIFRQLIVLLAFLVTIAIPFSCKKDEVKTEQLEPPKIENTDSVQVIVSGDTPEFRTRVYILDEETSSQIVSVTRNKIVIKKGAILRGGRTGGIAATEVKSGEIMAAGKTSKTPEGFNRKVTGVRESKDGTEIEIDTEDATLEDIFKNASFTIKKSFEHGASLDYTIGRSTGENGAGAGAELKTQGSASVSYGLEIPIEVKEYALKKIEARIFANPKVNLSITATGKITTGEMEVPVLTQKYVWVAWVPVGPVLFPILFVPKVEMAVTGEAGLEASATFNALDVSVKGELGAGYEVSKGLYGIATMENSENRSGSVTGKVKGYMQTGFKTTLSVSFYDLNFATFGDEAHLFARLEAECSSEGKGKADISITGGAANSAFVTFDLFGLKNNKASSADIKFGQIKLKLDNDLCGTDTTKKDSTSKVEPQPAARSTADPHLTTYDGARYSFMAAGEFVGTKSLTDKFEVQVRQEENKSKNTTATVSFNTAIAINTGSDIVSFHANKQFFVNHSPTSLPSQGSLSLPHGGSIDFTEGLAIVNTPAGDRIKVLLFASDLDYYIIPVKARRATLDGLFGNFDGNGSNDVHHAGGKTINPQVFSEMYPDFANSWRVKNSLFTYESGKNTSSYTNLAYPKVPVVINAGDRANAKSICERQGITDPVLLENCIVDVASTGDNSYATRHLTDQQQSKVISAFSIGNFNAPSIPLDYVGNAAITSGNVHFTNKPGSSGVSILGSSTPVDLIRGFEVSFDFSAKVGQNIGFDIAQAKFYSAVRRIGLECGPNATKGNVPNDRSDGIVIVDKPGPSVFDGAVHHVRIVVSRTNGNNVVLTNLFLDEKLLYQSSGVFGSGKSVLDTYGSTGDLRYLQLSAYGDPAWDFQVYNWTFRAK